MPEFALSKLPNLRSMARTATAIGAVAVGAVAVGALAVGAVAVGALAVGRLVIRRLSVDDGKLKSLAIEDLTVTRLHAAEFIVSDSLQLPDANVEQRISR